MTSQLMKIAKQSLTNFKASEELVVKEIVVGILYTAIRLMNDVVGVSFTLTDRFTDHEGYHQLLKDGFLSDKTLEELIDFCSSSYSILRSIGVAALNTFSQNTIDFSNASNLDAINILEPKKGEVYGMIGNIHPISGTFEEKGFKAKILDRFDPVINKKYLEPVENIDSLIDTDHLLISGSALVFDNFNSIISLLKNIPGKKILIGPSAQIIPNIAFEYGFSDVCSSKILNVPNTLKIIREGGGYRFFRTYARKYSFSSNTQ
jgi:uncharacterized protein (DUF4213/DUF364 family)